MFQFFANIFGYLLNFINNFVGNYGLAIIMFTILIKIIMLPLSIKQQRTMKKSSELQEKMKVLQFKYKNDPEKLNREMMDLYKKENMGPFSGCLSTIIQFILLISIFFNLLLNMIPSYNGLFFILENILGYFFGVSFTFLIIILLLKSS